MSFPLPHSADWIAKSIARRSNSRLYAACDRSAMSKECVVPKPKCKSNNFDIQWALFLPGSAHFCFPARTRQGERPGKTIRSCCDHSFRTFSRNRDGLGRRCRSCRHSCHCVGLLHAATHQAPMSMAHDVPKPIIKSTIQEIKNEYQSQVPQESRSCCFRFRISPTGQQGQSREKAIQGSAPHATGAGG